MTTTKQTEQPVLTEAEILEIALKAFTRLTESLTPSFEYVGVSLRVSQEDHAEIRAALAGSNTALNLLRQTTLLSAQQAAQVDAKDAALYRFLRDRLTWDVDMVKADGSRMLKGERFAANFIGRKSGDVTAEWKVKFNTDYGLHSDEDDLSVAIAAAISMQKKEQM